MDDRNLRDMKNMCDAFEAVAAAYVAEHETEAKKAQLAEALLRDSFMKCIYCKGEDKVVNLAAIELCQDEECPLQKFNTKIAAGVAIVLGHKTDSLWGDTH